MGTRTIVKYLTLATMALRIASKMYQKVRESTSEGSPGGEKVTFEEWVDMSLILQEEIMAALPDIETYRS